LAARRHQPAAVTFEILPSCLEELPAQVVGGGMNRLDVQLQAIPGQLLPGQREGRQQGDLAGDPALQGGRLAVVKAEDGQLGIETTAASGVFARARLRGTVNSRGPQEQAAEQTQAALAWLALAERPLRLGYFFFAASAQVG
jgi:hypothetical protein